jgi:hypothetical protein
MGSPGTRRARRKHMLELRKAKSAAEPAKEVAPVVAEEPVVVEAVEPAVEAPKEGLLNKAIRRGRRKKTEKTSEE